MTLTMTNNPYDHSLAAKGARATNTILSEFAAETTVRISIHQFRAEILPHLANPDNKDVSYWLNYVKHPSVPLYVIDDNGAVQYVVPPLSASISSTMAAFNTPSLDSSMENMRRRIERSPRSATLEHQRTLTPKIRHEENVLTNRIRLNQILVAEGYQPLMLPGTDITGVSGKSTTQSNQSTTTGYLDEYEDSNL
jgi:hypothetical protein